nr:EOG090X00I4 [Eulimnadia texana]
MLKFIRGKGSQPSAERLRIQKELFQFQKTVQHGFPSKPSALAWDPELRLMALATKTGAVKVYGTPGVEYYGQHEKEVNVHLSIFRFYEQGRIVSVCEDNSLSLFEVNPNSVHLKCVKSQLLEGKLKKISACCVESSGERLLIGTENGNIYSLDLNTFEMTESVIYVDVVLQSVADSFKVSPGAVESITEHPSNADCILIGYTRGLLVLWNKMTLSSEQTFVASQQLESVSWKPNGEQFMTSHNDGSYIVWSLKQSEEAADGKSEPAATTPYGPFPCKAINKIIWRPATGRYCRVWRRHARSSYGDRHTVSVQQGEKQHVSFDVSSKIVDFCLVDEASGERPEALVILAEEELIVVDLISEGWPCHTLPYLPSLHCSAITAQAVVSVTSDLYEKLLKTSQLNLSPKTSTRSWPIDGGVANQPEKEKSVPRLVLLTGHEDGSVRFWDASGVALKQIGKFSTAACFTGDDLDAPPEENNEDAEENEWPPSERVGDLDTNSSNGTPVVKKLCLCPVTGLLAVAGTAGQVVVAQLSENPAEKEIPVATMNVVSDRDNFVWKGHDKLAVRGEAVSLKPGFQPSSVLQLHPPAAITALVLNADWSVLAVGTAHGLALYDCVQHKGVLSKCTLNPNDVSGAGDQPMARRKSFKKSLRESFRRLRKGRSQRPAQTPKTAAPAAADGGSAPGPAAAAKAANSGPSTAAEARPVERQVEARATDDGMGSMVRCLLLVKTYIVNQSTTTTPTLWAGTNNGSIYVFSLGVPAADKRPTDSVTWVLAKEIQLKHRAPVIAVNVIDASCAAVPDAVEVAAGLAPQEAPGPHRVLISSEEQFKLFTLPNLRPYGKYKLTAYTGCQVRKVVVLPFVSRSDANYRENCLVCLANTGDVHVLSLPDLRRQMNAQYVRKEDIHGISSALLSRNGEGLYLQSSSELQRFALGTRDFLQVQCQLPQMKRPQKEDKTQTETENHEKSPEEAKPEPDTTVGTEVTLAVAAEAAEQANAAPPAEDEKEKAAEKAVDGNSTLVSVDQDVTETSFGDITMDSIKDHLAAALEESRVVEVKSERRVQESVTVVKTTTVVAGETIVKSAQVLRDLLPGMTSSSPSRFSHFFVENLLIFLEFSGHVEDVLLSGQRHRERVAFDDAVERVFLHLVLGTDIDHPADLFNDVLKQTTNR